MDGQQGDSPVDYHGILGVPIGATVEQIEAAYRRQARRWHPDVNHSPDAGLNMRRLNEARDALCGDQRAGDFSDESVPPVPVADPVTVDFGCVRPICRHPPVTVRLGNSGGPAASVSLEPEEGTFWSIAEIRGGEAEGEVAQFDVEACSSSVGVGHHSEAVQLFLDDVPIAVKLMITVPPSARPGVTLWTSAVVGLIAAAVLVVTSGGLSHRTFWLSLLVVVAVLGAGAVAGRAKHWPENWSSAWPAAVWYDQGHSSPFRLRHHVPWPAELFPASRRWTSARVDEFAEAAGVGPVETLFSARKLETRAGYRPRVPTRGRGPWGPYVFLPWTTRLTRAAVARAASHQVGHLAWPPFRHDADFFRRVQALLDATPCPACAARLRAEVP